MMMLDKRDVVLNISHANWHSVKYARGNSITYTGSDYIQDIHLTRERLAHRVLPCAGMRINNDSHIEWLAHRVPSFVTFTTYGNKKVIDFNSLLDRLLTE